MKLFQLFFFFYGLGFLNICSWGEDVRGLYDYALMMDAGSTGTRIYVYRWLAEQTGNEVYIVPETHKNWALSINPGINSYSSTPSLAGPSLKPLLKFGQEIVLQDQYNLAKLHNYSFPAIDSEFNRTIISKVRVFLKATAGMRMLNQLSRDEVIPYTP